MSAYLPAKQRSGENEGSTMRSMPCRHVAWQMVEPVHIAVVSVEMRNRSTGTARQMGRVGSSLE
jgi:hypothetical protein